MGIGVDTKGVVWGLLFGGGALKVRRAASLGIVYLFTSNALVAEFSEVIERPHLDRKFSEANATRRRLVSDYQAIVTVVNVAPLAERVSRDFDDDEVLACALAADCEFIVTGDKDLLVLSEYRGIRILNPTDFLAEIEL